ncbi:unnamed protein product [Macrosiphum euphorbiae]|uniref:Uncharacterized protein n=1 Tax=Macrosiphum euphorbiae TaxID=13131 RepID=A0AAV0X5U6_9HEMI|nr:unnamed protein product [Macrosiphum euphorbiae]
MTERDVQLRLDGDMSLAELIDTTDFVIDFIGRKSISIGLDPSRDFDVSIRIITPSRFVCITADFLRRLYSLMGHILSIITDPPVKSLEKLLLRDETITLCKISYRGNNMLVIESHRQKGRRVLLSRRNLLKLQDMQWIINEVIAQKSNIIRHMVMGQTDLMAAYLYANIPAEKSSSVEEITAIICNIHSDLSTLNIVPKNEYSFANQIKLFAHKQLAECWHKKMREDGTAGGYPINDDVTAAAATADVIEWPIRLEEIDGSAMFSYTNY